MKIEWNWPVIITALVAVYGAILSTFNIIANRRDKQQRLSVVLSNGFLTYGPNVGPLMLFIEIANVGSKVVTINSINIKLPKGESVPIVNIINPRGVSLPVSLPYTLEESKSCSTGVEIEKLAKAIIQEGYSKKIKLHATVSSGAGKIYKSKKAWILNLDKYNKQ